MTMSKGKIKAALFIIVFLLIVAVVCSWLVGEKDEVSTPQPDTPSGAPSIEIIQHSSGPSAPINSAAPSQSVPTPTPTPEVTPTPTPEPTPSPTPVVDKVTLGSGSFRSDTGVAINLRTEWSAVTSGANTVDVTVTVSLDHYSLITAASAGAVNLSLGGNFVSMNAPAINYEGTEQLNTVFGSKTFTVELAPGASLDMPLAIEWHFGGRYSNVDLDVIECGGKIQFTR